MTERSSGYGVLHPNTSSSYMRARARDPKKTKAPIVRLFNRQERFSGMRGLVTLHTYDILICGTGAIGRQVALALATMEVAKTISLVDPDVVTAPNVGTQGYRPDQVGVLKVEATKVDMLSLNPTLKVSAHKGMMGMPSRVGTANHWAPETQPHVLFLCCDDMITRNEISKSRTKAVRPTKFLIDTRMGAWACRVIADFPPFDRWKPTLFADSAAFSGHCTLQSTFFAALVCGGLAISALCTMVGAVKADSLDVIVNLLDADVTHQEVEEKKESYEQRMDRDHAVSNASYAATTQRR